MLSLAAAKTGVLGRGMSSFLVTLIITVPQEQEPQKSGHQTCAKAPFQKTLLLWIIAKENTGTERGRRWHHQSLFPKSIPSGS